LQQSLPQAAGVVVFSGVADQGAGTRIASAGASELSYQVEQNAYRVSAGAFFQVNRHLTNELVKVVVAAHSGGNALDLYAGAGLFSVPLARSFAQVIAVESSQTSYSDLLYNSPSNVKSVCAPVEQYLGKAAGKLDLVIVDPPRAGLGASVVRSLVGLRPPAIAYVSCDPATLARDLAPLLSAGYRVQQAHLLDMFPQTYHLETVLQLAL
jgi:23S rRNA (uracil1939-C5)-methyltransferase